MAGSDNKDVAFESFSRNASDVLRLRSALYGPEDASALMLRCYRKYPRAVRINESMVFNAWQEQDDALAAARDGITVDDVKATRQQRNADFLNAHRAKVSE